MSVATKEQILKVLKAYNPWWGTGVVNPGFTKTYRRFAYYEAMKRLEQKDLRRTIVLTGTRRVGKTTIQYQMIDRLLKKGVPPQKILFVSMDHPMLKLSGLNDLLECYHSNVYAEQDCYYFFDEIQYASDWDKWMKTIYDMQPETKMVATGSASPALMKGSSESGAGRWSVIQVPTLSFYEYCPDRCKSPGAGAGDPPNGLFAYGTAGTNGRYDKAGRSAELLYAISARGWISGACTCIR